ncbi:MAG: SurA N-terminal domain-containing protein [Desulfobacterales bacterium]|nr:MAG: SurA N-terminal domain-containing protein [Desulfobacterales bacterium]
MKEIYHKHAHHILAGRLVIAAAIFSTILFSGVTLAEELALVDRIVAVVNNELITLYDLNQKFEPYVKNIKALGYDEDMERKTLFKVRSDVLNQLIDNMLAGQQTEKYKLTVTEKEIDSSIERIKSARYYTDEDLRAGLAQQGLTMEDFRKEIKEQLLRGKLVNLEVKSKIVVTMQNIKSYYDSHPEKYVGEKKYTLWNIYVNIPSSAADSEKQSVLRKMQVILDKLEQGQKFEDLVNGDFLTSMQAKGGELGLFLLKELSAQLQKIVKNMQAGEFSSILDTEYGYQIIYVQNIIETKTKSLAEAEKEIEDILYKELVDNKYQEWLKELRSRSHIKVIN